MSKAQRIPPWRDRAWDFCWELYDRAVLRNPVPSLAVLAGLSLVCCWGLRGFRADASGDSLVLEHDDDVRYSRAISARYENSDFVVIAYEPPEGLFAPAALLRLKAVRDSLRKIPGVSSVITMLDVPLLRNPPGPLERLQENIKTLESPKASLRYAKEEVRTSPLYQNQLVGSDFKATAIQVDFLVDPADRELIDRRALLRERDYRKTITAAERVELKDLEDRYRFYKDKVAAQRHLQLVSIRSIINRHRSQARFYLGGIPMIIDDIMAYIRSDVVIFGIAIMLFIAITLYVIYGGIRWVLLPLGSCVLSVILMMGGMGLVHWDVTVVSANFVTLQLILTMELSIYVMSRYRELLWAKPHASNHDLVLEAVKEAFVPAFYMKLTTIVGFESLIFCDILPVVQFGWIMTLGVIVSMILIYWIVPAVMVLSSKPDAGQESEWGAPLTFGFARFTVNYAPLIYSITFVIAAGTALGISRLQVENSFVDYFRKDTDIYKGMKFIDESLGGTTPIEIILKLGSGKAPAKPADASADKAFDAFSEFEASGPEAGKYWYTSERLATIEKVHDYLEGLPETGKVMSLATLKKTAVTLNSGKPLDDVALAFLYNAVADRFKGLLISPYVSIENDEARITARIKDSSPMLHRAEFIRRIRADLVGKIGLKPDQFRISGLMLLYNNMLQSLYTSQIKSIGFSLLVLFLMLLALFRSVTISLIALFPQALASLSVLGVMGLGGISLDVMTITIVAIAMGIAVNNTIQYVYRFEKEIRRDGNYMRAMHHCHLTVGNPIFYTSLTITVGFAILTMSKFVPTIIFGLLIGLSMVVALLSSQTLLPALILWTKPFNIPSKASAQSDPAGGS
ncbi:MAG: MMPL family transporter [Elusimicrobia bacterium]|nr:MMPL family transporter [Elusimicrobiota bacterium]